MSDVTICIAAHNSLNSLQLTHESFTAHHGDGFRWHSIDDGSTEPVSDFLSSRSDLFRKHDSAIGHGLCLDSLCREVRTPLTLILDSDVEFLRPVLADMRSQLEAELNAICVAPAYLSKGAHVAYLTKDARVHEEVLFQGQRRIEPFCALFRTEPLKRLLYWFSFTVMHDYCRRRFYDTGGILYNAAKAAGYQVIEPPSLWRQIVHYGGMSTGSANKNNAWQKLDAAIRSRLELLRSGRQSLDGLYWTGEMWRVSE